MYVIHALYTYMYCILLFDFVFFPKFGGAQIVFKCIKWACGVLLLFLMKSHMGNWSSWWMVLNSSMKHHCISWYWITIHQNKELQSFCWRKLIMRQTNIEMLYYSCQKLHKTYIIRGRLGSLQPEDNITLSEL